MLKPAACVTVEKAFASSSLKIHVKISKLCQLLFNLSANQPVAPLKVLLPQAAVVHRQEGGRRTFLLSCGVGMTGCGEARQGDI